MKSMELAQPCRNFCILGSTLISKDPKDKKEKFVITTYVAGGIGKVILIDTHSIESESYDLPSDEGAWGLMYLEDKGKLIIGTCATLGNLHSFNLNTRTFEQPLRLDTETYLWNFARAKNGNVYASSFPGCSLVEYDPDKHTLNNAGKVGDDEENKYSRFTHTNADGNILVNSGFHKVEAFHYNVDTKVFTKFGDEGDSIKSVGPDYIFVQNNDYFKFYDPYSLEQIETTIHKDFFEDLSNITNSSIKKLLAEIINPPYIDKLPGKSGDYLTVLSDGRIIGIKGQELYIIDDDSVNFLRIPAEAPATAIMTLSTDKEGIIWGSCEFGQTIFSYNPNTGEYSNTAGVANAGGEVYGITHSHDKLFLTSYVGGDHIAYDPKKPWNQHDNINPKTVGSVAPDMVRPHGKSVIGPDGNVWTGWCASYGVYGGGITKIDTDTCKVSSWFPLIPEHAIESISASPKFIYAVTSGEASGLGAKEDGFFILRLDTDCNIVWRKQYSLGIHFRRVTVVGKYVLVSMVDKNIKRSKILVFIEETMEELSPIIIGEYLDGYEYKNMITEFIPYDENSVIAFLGNEALFIKLPSGEIIDRCTIEGMTQTGTIDSNKNIYFAIQQKIFKLELGSGVKSLI